MQILNEPRILAFLERHSHSTAPATAIFDCDGTVIRGDVGEAMFYYQIEHFLFRQSPAEIWTDHPMRKEIDTVHTELARAGNDNVTTHPKFHHFADLLLSWYFGQIAEGNVQKACADIVRLFAGFSLDEVRRIAEASFNRELATETGTRKLGERNPPRGIRFIREAVDLVGALLEHGIEIWAVSGSNKWSVEPVFRRLGIPAGRVIGIELLEHSGVLGTTAQTPIPIRHDKVGAFRRYSASVPVLVASDSRNDIPLFLLSSDLKVRINSRKRDTNEFFSSGRITRDESWVLVEEPTIVNL